MKGEKLSIVRTEFIKEEDGIRYSVDYLSDGVIIRNAHPIRPQSEVDAILERVGAMLLTAWQNAQKEREPLTENSLT